MSNTIDTFKTFLTQRNLYNEFITNYDDQDENYKEYSTIEEFLTTSTPSTFVLAAFPWDETPEGFIWSGVDDEWQEFLDIHGVTN